jgi:hypothetical protein
MNINEQRWNEVLKKQANKKHVPLLRVIRAQCLHCLGYQQSEVEACSAKGNCVLFPYRMGKNPFTKKTGHSGGFLQRKNVEISTETPKEV